MSALFVRKYDWSAVCEFSGYFDTLLSIQSWTVNTIVLNNSWILKLNALRMRGIVCVLTSETIELVTLIFKMRRHVP